MDKKTTPNKPSIGKLTLKKKKHPTRKVEGMVDESKVPKNIVPAFRAVVSVVCCGLCTSPSLIIWICTLRSPGEERRHKQSHNNMCARTIARDPPHATCKCTDLTVAWQ